MSNINPDLSRPQGHGAHGQHRPLHGPGEGPMGRPTPPDAASMAERLIQEADANGDGMLTRDELKAHFEARQSERMASPSDAPLDPADPGIAESLQTLLQTNGLAE